MLKKFFLKDRVVGEIQLKLTILSLSKKEAQNDLKHLTLSLNTFSNN